MGTQPSNEAEKNSPEENDQSKGDLLKISRKHLLDVREGDGRFIGYTTMKYFEMNHKGKLIVGTEWKGGKKFNNLRIYDVSTQKLEKKIRMNEGVYCLCVYKQYLAVGTRNKTIFFFNILENYKQVWKTGIGEPRTCHKKIISPSEDTLLSITTFMCGSAGGVYKITNLLEKPFSKVEHIYQHCGRRRWGLVDIIQLKTERRNVVVCGARPYRLVKIDFVEGKKVMDFPTKCNSCFSSMRSFLSSSKIERILCASGNEGLTLWGIDGQFLNQIELHAWDTLTSILHISEHLFILGGSNGNIFSFDLREGYIKGKLDCNLKQGRHSVCCLQWMKKKKKNELLFLCSTKEVSIGVYSVENIVEEELEDHDFEDVISFGKENKQDFEDMKERVGFLDERNEWKDFQILWNDVSSNSSKPSLRIFRVFLVY